MSTVRVQLFASYAEALGGPTIDLLLPPGSKVSDLLDCIRSLPAAAVLPPVPRVAINRSFASSEQIIFADDEIALIPPVSGG
ncbi:MAG: MoaD/ThiS family protein [Gemmatimonadaceae bacterium]